MRRLLGRQGRDPGAPLAAATANASRCSASTGGSGQPALAFGIAVVVVLVAVYAADAMDLGLSGRTAIVCGASQGIGLAVAEVLAEEGANVAMFARRREVLEREAERIGGLADPRRRHEPSGLRAARRGGRSRRSAASTSSSTTAAARPAGRTSTRRGVARGGRVAAARVRGPADEPLPALPTQERGAAGSSTSSRARSASRSTTSRSRTPSVRA